MLSMSKEGVETVILRLRKRGVVYGEDMGREEDRLRAGEPGVESERWDRFLAAVEGR